MSKNYAAIAHHVPGKFMLPESFFTRSTRGAAADIRRWAEGAERNDVRKMIGAQVLIVNNMLPVVDYATRDEKGAAALTEATGWRDALEEAVGGVVDGRICGLSAGSWGSLVSAIRWAFKFGPEEWADTIGTGELNVWRTYKDKSNAPEEETVEEETVEEETVESAPPVESDRPATPEEVLTAMLHSWAGVDNHVNNGGTLSEDAMNLVAELSRRVNRSVRASQRNRDAVAA